MIDYSDAGDALDSAASSGGGWALVIVLLLAIGLYLVASSNDAECAKLYCHSGATPQLMDHECRCVESASPWPGAP